MTNDVISDIVDVTITRQTQAVSQQGYGTVMILSLHKYWNDRIRFYSSINEVSTDGFLTNSPEYIAAQQMFSEAPGPTQIAIGRRSIDVSTVTVSTVDDTHLYSITINGTACTYQASGSDSGTAIASALATAINTAA
jgi:hypothetical protein